MIKRLWIGLVGPLAAANLLAQQPALSAKLAEVQPTKYAPPLCPIKPAGKVEKAVDLLKKSYDPKADRAAVLGQAKDLITQSVATENQGSNAATWYYLARVYLMQGDAIGVDSAFTKAEKLQPTCEIDINQYRQNSWAALANAGLELQKKGDTQAALTLFRDASVLFTKMPHVFGNMGVIYANGGKDDSAAVYFSKALAVAEADTTMRDDRNAYALNLALMYQRLDRHKEAIPILRKYLTWDPKNSDARKALAQSFRSAGMADSAEVIDSAMLTEISKQNFDSLDTGDLMNVGVAAFNAKEYAKAASAFSKAAQRNPYSRDAVYNLANAYLALNDHQKLVETGDQLLKLEPLNEDDLRLVAQGYRGLKQQDQVLKTAEKLVGLPVTIDVTAFQMGKSSAKLGGTITGRNPTDAQGKPVKPAPITITVEFVQPSGTVVDSKDVSIGVLAPGATQQLAVEGKGDGIAGWRYKVK